MRVRLKFSLVDLGVRYANKKLILVLMFFFTVTILTITICNSPISETKVARVFNLIT